MLFDFDEELVAFDPDTFDGLLLVLRLSLFGLGEVLRRESEEFLLLLPVFLSGLRPLFLLPLMASRFSRPIAISVSRSSASYSSSSV